MPPAARSTYSSTDDATAPTVDELAAVLAVDGGNSKADVVLVAADGRLLARVVGPTVSHQAVGLEEAWRRSKRWFGKRRISPGWTPTPDPWLGSVRSASPEPTAGRTSAA